MLHSHAFTPKHTTTYRVTQSHLDMLTYTHTNTQMLRAAIPSGSGLRHRSLEVSTLCRSKVIISTCRVKKDSSRLKVQSLATP